MKTRFLAIVILLSGLIGISTLTTAQTPVYITIGNYTATPGQQITMPVTAINYADIASISMKLFYNFDVITFNGYSLGNGVGPDFHICDVPYPGNLRFALFSLTPLSYIDTIVFLNLNFTYNSGACDLVWDTLTIGNAQFSSTWGDVVPTVFVNGTVNGGTPPNSCSNTIGYTPSGMSMQFSGSSSGTGPVSYHWYFGDGWTDTAQNPVHTYATSGNYAITLVTYDSMYCFAYSSMTIPSSAFNVGINGTIYANGLLDAGEASMYYLPFNQPTGSFVLHAVQPLSNSYSFSASTPGYYIVKAQPDSTSIAYGSYIPTYYGDTPYWTDADTISTSLLNNPYDINLVYAPGPTPGPGNITGMITIGTKLFTSGTPAVGAEILLTDNNNLILVCRYSDINGNFSFNNLAYGTYKVRAEVTSVPVTPTILTLSAANPASNNLNFVITPSGIVTNITEEPENKQFAVTNVFPNPANNLVNIDLVSEKFTSIAIDFFDVTGRKVTQFNRSILTGPSQICMDIEALKTGPYFVKIHNAEGRTFNEIVNIIR